MASGGAAGRADEEVTEDRVVEGGEREVRRGLVAATADCDVDGVVVVPEDKQPGP